MVSPLTKRALEIREANPDTKTEDLALALELQADVLGRSSDGAPFWIRATAIRAQRVAAIQAAASVEQTPSASLDNGAPPQRIGGDVSAPVVIAKREPAYTEPARLAHYSGSARLAIVIDANGIPKNFKLVKGLGYGLDEQAALAVSTWRFKAATKNDQPVAVMAQIEVNFRLL